MNVGAPCHHQPVLAVGLESPKMLNYYGRIDNFPTAGG